MNNSRLAIGFAILLIISAGAMTLCDSEQTDGAQFGDIQMFYNGQAYEITYTGSEDVDGMLVVLQTMAGSPARGNFDGSTATVSVNVTATGPLGINAIAIPDLDLSLIRPGSDTIVSIEFVSGTGSGSEDTVYVSSGYSYTLPKFTDTSLTAPANEQFQYWYVDGMRYDPGEAVTITANTIVTPIYGTTAVLTGIIAELIENEYRIGESPELTVTANYSDGSTNVLDAGDYEVSPSKFEEAGTVEVTVTYGDFSDTVTVTVIGEPATYTVTWVVDGVETEQTYEYGEIPDYGSVPVKEADAQYTYTFAGWTPEIGEVTGDTTYTALFTETVNVYTVTWENWDGTVLESQEVPYGTVPDYAGVVPARPSTDSHSYTFAGWTPEIGEVTGDTTYVATYTEHAVFGGYQFAVSSGFGGDVTGTPGDGPDGQPMYTVTISPMFGFIITDVSVDGVYTNVVITDNSDGDKVYTLYGVQSDISVDVTFTSIGSDDDDEPVVPPVQDVSSNGNDNSAIIVGICAAVLIIVFAAIYVIYGRKD